MKLGPATKPYKRNKTISKKFDDNFMPKNCDVIVIFSIYCQCEAIWKPDSTPKSVKLKFSLTKSFYLRKTDNRTEKSLRQLSHFCLELRYYFCQKY